MEIMSVHRRREKAARNRANVERNNPAVAALIKERNAEWIASGRMAGSYGVHEVVDSPDGKSWSCPRCGAEYMHLRVQR